MPTYIGGGNLYVVPWLHETTHGLPLAIRLWLAQHEAQVHLEPIWQGLPTTTQTYIPH